MDQQDQARDGTRCAQARAPKIASSSYDVTDDVIPRHRPHRVGVGDGLRLVERDAPEPVVLQRGTRPRQLPARRPMARPCMRARRRRVERGSSNGARGVVGATQRAEQGGSQPGATRLIWCLRSRPEPTKVEACVANHTVQAVQAISDPSIGNKS
jgi:hypothetical protein